MDILKNEILPLFEITRKSQTTTTNNLIQTASNEYSLYVDLSDIYHKRSQTYEIITNQQSKMYTIPLQYHEIVLRGKGSYYEDLTINIYSLKHPEFLRINTSDLFLYRKLSSDEWNTGQYVFEHLSGEQMTVNLKPTTNQILTKISHEGLPVPRAEYSRGSLYVWLIREDLNDENTTSGELELLLEMLNYHPNSNVVLPQ